MYIILGATGHVGSAVTESLLRKNQPVLAVIHDSQKKKALEDKGVSVEVADVILTEKTHKIFKRGQRIFLLNPPGDPSGDSVAEEKKSLHSILSALDGLEIEKVVAESTYGSQPGEAIGDLAVLHELEEGLKARSIPSSIIRAAYYMSNWDAYLKMAKEEGKIQTFYPEHFKIPTVSPDDIGLFASELLQEDSSRTGVHYIEGPERYSAHDVARAFSLALGKTIRVEVIPKEKWVPYLLGMGFSESSAQSMAAMTAITLEGRYEKPTHFRRGTTSIDAYVEGLVKRSVQELKHESYQTKEIVMSEKSNSKNSVQGNPLEITRSFDVPREVLFNAFTDGDIVKQWWGPDGFTSPSYQIEARVGGRYLGCMKSPDGKKMWSTGTVLEFQRPEKLKYSDCFADEKGNVVPATYYHMSSDFPLECVVELSFIKDGDGTKLHLKHFGIPESEMKDCKQGWSQCLDKLKMLVEDESQSDLINKHSKKSSHSPDLSV